MKTPAVALTVPLLLCSLSVGISSGNDTDTNCPPATVTRDDTTFEIVHYRHGRSGVSFENDAHEWSSEYIFNKAGYVATITAGSEEYKVEYDDQGDVEDVRRVDYGSRALAGEGDNAEDASERAAMMRRRLTETCEDCEKAWDTVCGDGLTSLCYLEEGYGSVFGPMATESIETMCSTFLSACAGTSAGDVCEDRRDGYDDGSGSSSSSSDDSDSSSDSSDSSSDDSDSSSDSGSSDSSSSSSSSSDSSSSDSSSSDSSSSDSSSSDNSSSDSSSDDSDSSSSDDSDSGSDDGSSSDDSGGDDGDGGIDACDPNPCLNGGSCSVDVAGGHICTCPSGYGGMACATDTSDLPGFYIEVAYLGDAADWTDGRKAAFTDAAGRWEEVVINQRCPVGTSDIPGRLLINASLEYIDGPDNTLGEAGPRKTLDDCVMTSIAGEMIFDTADVELMETSGNFDTVVLHEMGHVIGVGTLWGDCSTCDPFLTYLDPEWKCPATIAVYNDLLGNSGGTEADIIELEGGEGTACVHFAEAIFGDELTSGLVDTSISNVYSPLSKITAASLDDTGYVVNATVVDPYTLPSRRSGEAAVEVIDSGSSFVIKSAAVKSVVELVDSNGDVVGETTGVRMNLYRA